MAWRATSNAMNLPQRAHELLEQQKTEWDVLRDGYASLARVETRAFDFDGFQVQLHFNPGGISWSAKFVIWYDPTTIATFSLRKTSTTRVMVVSSL